MNHLQVLRSMLSLILGRFSGRLQGVIITIGSIISDSASKFFGFAIAKRTKRFYNGNAIPP
jgi:hypothetical protein